MSAKPLVLRTGADKRLRAGHVWIYSNEVDTKATPLKDFEPGEEVQVVDSQGRPRASLGHLKRR